jgi:hypothetical protein
MPADANPVRSLPVLAPPDVVYPKPPPTAEAEKPTDYGWHSPPIPGLP